VIATCIEPHAAPRATDKRGTERRTVSLPARLTWKDARGTIRFATGVTRNISAHGVYVECHSPVSIPLYRIVQFQIDRDGLATGAIPPALRGRVLSAVYRISPASMSKRQGFALRLMVDPRAAVAPEQTRATA
jgi:hypothetical protein